MGATSIYKSPAGEQAVMDLYDRALERWPVPHETRMIPTRHGDTFVIASGDESKPVMMLLHGAASNSAIWGGDVAEYSRHYRVYAADLPGEPGKSAPNRPAWDGPAFAEWLADVLDVLAIDRAVLVGMSQGGWTALKFAVSYPARVDKLVLICPGGVTVGRVSFFLRMMVLMLFGRWGARRVVRMLFAREPIPDGVEDILTTVMSNFKPRVGVPVIFTDEELRRLTMPVFLIGGDQDGIFDNEKNARRLGRLVPDLTVKTVPGAGHAILHTVGPVRAFLSPDAAPGVEGRGEVQRVTEEVHHEREGAL
jgi:pimeloyl-ACP methyl ester carboxylesterase